VSANESDDPTQNSAAGRFDLSWSKINCGVSWISVLVHREVIELSVGDIEKVGRDRAHLYDVAQVRLSFQRRL
jgi:hypothetical protein